LPGGDAPPWAVESPGAAGASFALGLDAFSDREDDLTLRSARSVITTCDLQTGAMDTQVLEGDPALLSRKFRFESRLSGGGAQVPVRLPVLPLGGGLRIYPSLVLLTGRPSVTLDFHDRPEPANSESASGGKRGYGAGLNLFASLCRECPWFAGVSYRYQRLPSFSLDRSVRLDPESFETESDAVHLTRSSREIGARLGYTWPGNRVATYLGLRRSSTRMAVRDQLNVEVPTTQTEIYISSRTRFEEDVYEGIAGVDAHFGGPLYGRFELALGSGSRAGLLKMVYLLPRGRSADGEASPRSAEQAEEDRRRNDAISAEIAPALAEIEAAFLAGWKALPGVETATGEPGYPEQSVADLLNKTERDLLAVLRPYPELVALSDGVSYGFQQARRELGLPPAVAAVLASLAPPRLASQPRALDRGSSDRTLGDLHRNVIHPASEGARTRTLLFTIRFESDLNGDVSLHPRYDRSSSVARKIGNGQETEIWRGIYSFDVTPLQGGKKLLQCDGTLVPPGPNVLCPLDLMKAPRVLRCRQGRCNAD
jgi:hypothetical protein